RQAAEDYTRKDGFLKAVEEKTGVPLDAAVKNGETLKDVITNLGDWAGVDLGDGKKIPEDIVSQIQAVAKEQGYKGYSFETASDRQAHIFDPKAEGMQLSNVQHADPSATPDLPGQPQPAMETSKAAADATEQAKSQNYSPSVQEALNAIRKNAVTLHPDDLKAQLAEVEKTMQEHKQMLAQLAEGNPDTEEALKELRQQEAHDKRMLDVAQRIMDCGATE
ncbi:MAG: hypothetical protein ACREJM_11795, partial [Candidatus Saccharimonadales bacterium]